MLWQRHHNNALDIGEDTYIADSTHSDPKLGIDADFGLFASRSFEKHLTRKNDNFITYYEGTVMSPEELERILRDPSYTRTTAIIINFQGRSIDGYDHDRDTYACDGAIINDFHVMVLLSTAISVKIFLATHRMTTTTGPRIPKGNHHTLLCLVLILDDWPFARTRTR